MDIDARDAITSGVPLPCVNQMRTTTRADVLEVYRSLTRAGGEVYGNNLKKTLTPNVKATLCTYEKNACRLLARRAFIAALRVFATMMEDIVLLLHRKKRSQQRICGNISKRMCGEVW